MTAPADVLAHIRGRMAGLTRNQRHLAEFARRDPQTMAVSTVTELSGLTGVSPATIVRFSKALGFEGFTGLQRELRRSLRAGMRGPDRFRHARTPDPVSESALTPAIRQEMANLTALQDQHDADSFGAAVRMLSDAPRITVIGSRSTAPLAHHLWFGLTKAGLPADCATSAGSHAHDLIDRLAPDGCAVVIGFPRYLAELVTVADAACAAGLPVLVISDSPFSPLHGTVRLFAPVESASFVAFHAAPMVLIAALLSGIAADRPNRTLAALNRFEARAARQGLFLPPEPPQPKD